MISGFEPDAETGLWWTVDEAGLRVKSYTTKRHARNAMLRDLRATGGNALVEEELGHGNESNTDV
jgi:hypothetical protein